MSSPRSSRKFSHSSKIGDAAAVQTSVSVPRLLQGCEDNGRRQSSTPLVKNGNSVWIDLLRRRPSQKEAEAERR